nr:CGCGG family rSAM-modified RiPP protein [Natronomonas sp. LN261]
MIVVETYESREPVTIRTHHRPWAANLETDAHATDRSLVVEESIDAVEQTRDGQFVDLITHGEHGHPSTYLYSELRSMGSVAGLAEEGRCSCGGYVTRVRTERRGGDGPS